MHHPDDDYALPSRQPKPLDLMRVNVPAQPGPHYSCRCHLCGTPRPNMRSTLCSWCDAGKKS